MNPKIYQSDNGTWYVKVGAQHLASFNTIEDAKEYVQAFMNIHALVQKPKQTKTVYVIEFAEGGRKTAYYSPEGWWYDIEKAQHHDSQTMAESCAFRLTTEQPYYAARLSIKEHVVEL